MFIYTTRLHKVRLIVILLVIAALIITSAAMLSRRHRAQSAFSHSNIVKSADDIVSFLLSCGWEVEPIPLTEQTVLIPKTFSAVYNEYNKIQLAQGCDLTDYAGLEVTRYTFEVKNYPDYSGSVLAEVLVYKNCVIGGDIHAAAMDGFMQALE